MTRSAAFFSILAMLGCGGGGSSSSSSSSAASTGGDDTSGSVVVIEEDDDPRVSRSAGTEGGLVVLWPRVMGLPESEPAVVQQHMVALARRALPGVELDIRPDPERVCPRSGCNGASLGALLVAHDGSCATVAVLGRRGQGELTLLPWSGQMTIRDRNIPFREPPESHVVLQDRHFCSELESSLSEHDAEVERGLHEVFGR